MNIRTETAANRRAILANAHSRYFSSHRSGDDSLALERALLSTNTVKERIVDITVDGTQILVTLDGTFEVIEIDAYGNTLRGLRD